MTEYWVSQSKHYCKFCKVWLANNKPSIQVSEKLEKRAVLSVRAFLTRYSGWCAV